MMPHYNLPLRLFYSDHYHFPLPPGHKFPLAKYRLLRELLTGDRRFRLDPAPIATREELVRVHDKQYVDDFMSGELRPEAIRRIGLPWSPEFVQRTLASAGGTLAATKAALAEGFGGALAGGTHHAFRDQGSGFCVFNDLAIAIAWARGEARVRRTAVIDLDVHQGDGTAAIFQDDKDVYTLSLHGAKNFPFRKQKSTVDIELADGTTDAIYLEQLEHALLPIWEFAPDLVLFQSGVDGLASDRLGRLSLTREGLASRDIFVIEQVRKRSVPLVIVLGGGYSEPIELTVEAHAQTFRIAVSLLTGLSAQDLSRSLG